MSDQFHILGELSDTIELRQNTEEYKSLGVHMFAEKHVFAEIIY